ncbi:MAG: aminoglycoside phosphotransferase family protein [Chloroflexota bacterium]
MIEGFDSLLEDSGQPGLPELHTSLQELLGGPDVTGRVIGRQRLKSRVYRLQLDANGQICSLVVKRLDPEFAQRNQLVTERWLPAIGLSECSPPLLGVAADRSGQSVWHIYKDLGDRTLATGDLAPKHVEAAIDLIAQLHIRFAGHPLLPECRRYGGDLGIHHFTSNVRDAICGLELLRPPAIALSSECLALRDRLLERMYKLFDERPFRAQALAELGGPETLLHGDLWTTNIFVLATPNGSQARLIDWDRVGVGPVSYDLSTFLLRFPTHQRLWLLDMYREAAGSLGQGLPAAPDLNLLFETAECARFANRVIWPAIALLQDRAEWGFDELAAIEQWFEMLEPVLPLSKAGQYPVSPGAVQPVTSSARSPVAVAE